MGMDVSSLIERVGGRKAIIDRLKVSRPTVIGWEKDNVIPALRIAQISEMFGVPLKELMPIASRAKPPAQPGEVA
jgi:DNA-binding transcriptional regulator YdaS (Cro superfamily)